MSAKSAVLFCMRGQGHFQRLRPLIAGLARCDIVTYVFTEATFRAEVERLGGRFVDLYAGRPPEEADATTTPRPCREVSFAGHYGDDVVREVAALRPAIVLHDSFAVIAVVVANHLELPRVNVCAGHNRPPGAALEALRGNPRVNISEDCWRAVRLLRERHGMPDASPFSFADTLSTDLNVYCEPPQFLHVEERAPFQPIAFMGSLLPDEPSGADASSGFGLESDERVRIYASFGTRIWRLWADQALNVLEALSEFVAQTSDTVALISLGGFTSPQRAARLVRANVQVEPYVDQWSVLGKASVFLTHHGLNSTHEAIFHQTPMISYPFFVDQPALAARCQALGLAIPLVETLRGAVGPQDIGAALARVAAERTAIGARLAEARRWELETIAARPAVIARIIDLMR
ncbi:MAG TPA: glycosyltransferase [Candidatus Kryptonia bacterium]|nr:glycosyltransferase [Candidatus Kryptonia bacterium]